MVDKRTRELIRLYMEFSNHNSLSVKEFLQFRKEAIKECAVLSELPESVPPIKNNIGQETSTISGNTEVVQTKSEPSQVNIPIFHAPASNRPVMDDSELLAMMSSIED